jgi:hypothetical protein
LSRRFVEGLKGFVSSHPGHNAGRWSQDQKTPVAYAGAVVIALLAVLILYPFPVQHFHDWNCCRDASASPKLLIDFSSQVSGRGG